MPVRVSQTVVYWAPKRAEQDALVVGVHETSGDITCKWLSLVITREPGAVCEVQGVEIRQTQVVVMVPPKERAGPGHYWREKDASTPRT